MHDAVITSHILRHQPTATLWGKKQKIKIIRLTNRKNANSSPALPKSFSFFTSTTLTMIYCAVLQTKAVRYKWITAKNKQQNPLHLFSCLHYNRWSGEKQRSGSLQAAQWMANKGDGQSIKEEGKSSGTCLNVLRWKLSRYFKIFIVKPFPIRLHTAKYWDILKF